jgi:hypothetical protein
VISVVPVLLAYVSDFKHGDVFPLSVCAFAALSGLNFFCPAQRFHYAAAFYGGANIFDNELSYLAFSFSLLWIDWSLFVASSTSKYPCNCFLKYDQSNDPYLMKI